MLFVTVQPEVLNTAAGDLQGIGATVAAYNKSIAAPTTGIAPAAEDEVSALLATRFAAQGHLYQAISAQAQAVHEQFVATLTSNADSYAITEAANALATG